MPNFSNTTPEMLKFYERHFVFINVIIVLINPENQFKFIGEIRLLASN
jgi:hypothetical protein